MVSYHDDNYDILEDDNILSNQVSSNIIINYNLAPINNSRTNEFDDYFTSKLEFFFSEIDILQYWNGKKNVYPTLSNVAKKVLTARSSTAFIEGSFSKAKHLISDQRTRMNPELIEAILLIQSWEFI
jgi:hypothetical protein